MNLSFFSEPIPWISIQKYLKEQVVPEYPAVVICIMHLRLKLGQYVPSNENHVSFQQIQAFVSAELDPYPRHEDRLFHWLAVGSERLGPAHFMGLIELIILMYPPVSAPPNYHHIYKHTTIMRLFWFMNASRTGSISLREFRYSGLWNVLQQIDRAVSIELLPPNDWFSFMTNWTQYQTFLDLRTRFGVSGSSSSQMLLDPSSVFQILIQKWNGAAVELKIPLERWLQSAERGLSDGELGFGRRQPYMTFADFIYMLNANVHVTPTVPRVVLQYWMRCWSLTEDGVIWKDTPLALKKYADILEGHGVNSEKLTIQQFQFFLFHHFFF